MRINNFGPNNYRAASDNFYGLESDNGIWYFANENGVLEYDGSSWTLITISKYSSVHALANGHEENRIYVGGNDEFGYIEKDSSRNRFIYHSLRHLVDPDTPLSEIWNIIVFQNLVYFECREKILMYDGDKISEIPLTNAYLFTIDDRLYASIYSHGLARIEKDQVRYVNREFKFANDAAFHGYPCLDPENQGKYLLITSFNGFYTLDSETNTVEKWPTEIDDLLRDDGIADVIIWRDSLYAVSTLYSGLVFLDANGKVRDALGEDPALPDAKDQISTLFDQLDPQIEGLINEKNGLPTDQLRSLFQDARGNIWVSSLYGLSYLKWDTNYPEDFRPKTVLRTKEINLSDTLKSRSVQFAFATPGYDRSDLEYSFYLEGFEDSWLPWTDEVKKEYTNLDGGKYTFHVKARTTSGYETEQVTFTFLVPTLWYKNIWTYFFGFSILAVFIWFGFRLHTLHLKSLNRRLESIIENRTKELLAQKEQLKNANDDLKQINTELDNFVYRSSHDLVAPLKSIRGLINVAKKDNPGNTLAYLDMMESSVFKLEDFIKSIMEYSTNTKKEVVFKCVQFDDIINEIADEIKFYKNAEKVELIKEYKPDAELITDADRLKIIMSNLITNGIKYHDYDRPEPFLKVSLVEENSHYRIRVDDNGSGIESEHLDKIFNMFYRASDASEGSGLGLYIVKDTLEKMKGKIKVESDFGIGTFFEVILPVGNEEPEQVNQLDTSNTA